MDARGEMAFGGAERRGEPPLISTKYDTDEKSVLGAPHTGGLGVVGGGKMSRGRFLSVTERVRTDQLICTKFGAEFAAYLQIKAALRSKPSDILASVPLLIQPSSSSSSSQKRKEEKINNLLDTVSDNGKKEKM
jgi:hypothetical protein